MGDAELALRLFLPCYFVVYILVGGPLQVAAVRKKYGIDPLAAAQPDPVMRLGESYRNVMFAAALAIVLLHALHPPVLAYLGPIAYLQIPAVRCAGVVILLGALLLVRVAQVQMKGSWRYGFDRAGATTELIMTGLYARSRNPIHVGMCATGLGLFLVLPNAATFAIANLTVLLLQVRARVEEQYLTEKHGAAYEAYCRNTPRWF